MSILEKYVASEWCKWFILISFFLFSILFLQMLTGEMASVSSFLDFGQSFKSILSGLIEYIPWVVPISCFFTTLVTVSFFKQRGEYLGMLSCSFSWIRCSRVIFVLGFVISFLCWVSVKSENDLRIYLDTSTAKIVGKSHFQMKIGSDRFWYFENFNHSTLEGQNVQLYAYDSLGNNEYRVRAKSAKWTTARKWVFEDGQFIGFVSKKGLPIYNARDNSIEWAKDIKRDPKVHSKLSPDFSKKFEKLNLQFELDNPDVYILLSQSPKVLSLEKLKYLINRYPNSEAQKLLPYRYRLAQMNWNAISCFLSIFCATIICSCDYKQSIGEIISLSLLGAVCFYILRTTCDSFGEYGIAPPLFTAGIPYLGILVLGVLFYLLRQSKWSLKPSF